MAYTAFCWLAGVRMLPNPQDGYKLPHMGKRLGGVAAEALLNYL